MNTGLKDSACFSKYCSFLTMGFFDFLKKDTDGKSRETSATKANNKHSIVSNYELIPDVALCYNVGMEKYARQDYMGAALSFGGAIELMPTNAHFYALRANCHEDLGNDVWAEIDFKKSVELDPSQFVSLYRLGMLYSRKKDLRAAIDYLKKAYDIAPSLTDFETLGLGKNNALFVGKQVIGGNLGNFLMQTDQLEEAIKYLNDTILLAPDYPNSYMAKGLTLAKMGSFAQSKAAFQKAASLGMMQAHQGLAMVNQMSGGQY